MNSEQFSNELTNAYNNGIAHSVDVVKSHYTSFNKSINAVLDTIVEKLEILQIPSSNSLKKDKK